MKFVGQQGKSLVTDEASTVLQAVCTPKASVGDDRGVMETALATTRFTAKEVSDQRWTELVENGPIGFRSGTDLEGKEKQVGRGVLCSQESRETVNSKNQIFLENQNHDVM